MIQGSWRPLVRDLDKRSASSGQANATPLNQRTAAAIIELLERERLMTLACLRPTVGSGDDSRLS